MTTFTYISKDIWRVWSYKVRVDSQTEGFTPKVVNGLQFYFDFRGLWRFVEAKTECAEQKLLGLRQCSLFWMPGQVDICYAS